MFRFLVIFLALVIDLRLGDPPNKFHPLILMGRFLSFGRFLVGEYGQITTRSWFYFGTFWTLAGIGYIALPLRLLSKRIPLPKNKQRSFVVFIPPLLLHAALLKPVFAYRGLREAVKAIIIALEAGDIDKARHLLSWHLVSRDTNKLAAEEVAGAAIESLAENLTDSVTAPLLAYAVGGLPAAWAYRFVNTADAMWGYRTEEFEYLGKFPARLDDALNWLPARLTGWLLVVAAWLFPNANGYRAARTMLTQHRRTASPNAGWTMSAMAGALGITLTKREVYKLEGGGKKLNPQNIKRALHLADICIVLNTMLIFTGLAISHIIKSHKGK